jgi:hypothetical protein
VTHIEKRKELDMAAKHDRNNICELYIDDNQDITFLTHRLSRLLRQIKKDHERIVVKVQEEEKIILLKKGKNREKKK